MENDNCNVEDFGRNASGSDRSSHISCISKKSPISGKSRKTARSVQKLYKAIKQIYKLRRRSKCYKKLFKCQKFDTIAMESRKPI